MTANRNIDEKPNGEARYHHGVELVFARIILGALVLAGFIWLLFWLLR